MYHVFINLQEQVNFTEVRRHKNRKAVVFAHFYRKMKISSGIFKTNRDANAVSNW
jgi:hypothetical protein